MLVTILTGPHKKSSIIGIIRNTEVFLIFPMISHYFFSLPISIPVLIVTRRKEFDMFVFNYKRQTSIHIILCNFFFYCSKSGQLSRIGHLQSRATQSDANYSYQSLQSILTSADRHVVEIKQRSVSMTLHII